jgi:23S rRNA (guanine2445-N2)-methyltransferase / 23S rRNA (guanine2069-N7)-methyltransferase
MAADMAPGLLREHWGFAGWKQHDAPAWRGLVDEAQERAARGLQQLPDIRGYDRDPGAVRAALANCERAGLAGRVHFERRELSTCTPVARTKAGLVVANPPYGERLGADSDLPALYASLGKTLRENFQGWRAAVFTGNPELGRAVGLRARRIHSLYNGALECKLLHFDVDPEWYLVERRFPRPIAADERGEGAAAFSNRLRKNLRQLERWRQREGIECYRLYDADLPEYALAIDIYEGEKRWLHVQEYEAPQSIDPRKARHRLREALGVILDVLDVPEDQFFFKVRRQQKGRIQYERLDEKKVFHEVHEGGCRFLVNFEDYLDTGLFLDHRITRRLVAQLAAGRRFLNLFAYTGTATVCAAKAGASATTTVDMSNTYVDWARRNLELNGFRGPEHELVRADCLDWLQRGGDGRRFAVIFLDPPSFSASKRMQGSLDVQRDHVRMIRSAVPLLEADGVLVFSNNLRRFRLDTGGLAGLDITEITRETIPRDFERNPRIHHCWKIRPTGVPPDPWKRKA